MNEQKRQEQAGEWSWLRVFYYEDCKDNLIFDGIWPAILSTAAFGAKGFFKRDWIGGPNVLIGLSGAPANGAAILKSCKLFLNQYLNEHPSCTPSTLDFHALMKPYERWELQQQDDLKTSLQPDNSILVETTEPYSPIIEDPHLKHFLREFLCESSGIVIDWLDLVRQGHWERQHIALTALIALIWLAEPQNLRAHMSFRSHAEGFFGGSEIGSLLQSKFAEHYEREREQMRSFMEKTVDQLRQGTDFLPGIHAYLALLRKTLQGLAEGLEQQNYHVPKVRDLLGKLTLGDAVLLEKTNERYGRLFAHLDTVPAFRAWQITVSLVYLMLNQFGLRPFQRFLGTYLITRTAEDLYGHKASELAEMIGNTGDVGCVLSFARKDAFAGWGVSPADGGVLCKQ